MDDSNTSQEAISYSPIEVLATLQCLNKDEEALRKQWIADLDGLVRLIVKNEGQAEGITYAALGGIQYTIHQLQRSYACRELEDLERRYSEDELRSYPQSQAEVRETCEYHYQPGMEIMIDKVNLPVGTRFRIYIAKAFSRGRQLLTAGTLLHSTSRQYPPLSKIHEHF